MISQVFHPDCFKVITLFSLSPGSRFKRKEIKDKMNIHNLPLDKALMRLLSAGILKKEGTLYSINFENPASKKVLEIVTSQFIQLKELPLDVYCLLMDLTDRLSVLKGSEVFLFGSYAKLTYTSRSDLDIALLHTKEVEASKIKKSVMKLERAYKKHVEIHYFDKKDFYRNKKDPLVRSILKDGVRLT